MSVDVEVEDARSGVGGVGEELRVGEEYCRA